MDQTVKTFTSEGADARKWIGRMGERLEVNRQESQQAGSWGRKMGFSL